MASSRPLGVSILSVIAIVVGLSLTAGGFYYAAGGNPNFGYYNVQNGLLGVISGWGLWKGKGWGWNLFLIILVVSLVITPFGLAILPIAGIASTAATKVVTVLLIYYITRKEVMTFFGKTSVKNEFF